MNSLLLVFFVFASALAVYAEHWETESDDSSEDDQATDVYDFQTLISDDVDSLVVTRSWAKILSLYAHDNPDRFYDVDGNLIDYEVDSSSKIYTWWSNMNYMENFGKDTKEKCSVNPLPVSVKASEWISIHKQVPIIASADELSDTDKDNAVVKKEEKGQKIMDDSNVLEPGERGVDFSVWQKNVRPEVMEAIKDDGNTFVILQVFTGRGEINPYLDHQYKTVIDAGLRVQGFYIFPSFPKDAKMGVMASHSSLKERAKKEAQTSIEYLKKKNWLAGRMLWFDVESCSGTTNCWFRYKDSKKYNQKLNQVYLEAWLKELGEQHRSDSVGIYSGYYIWGAPMSWAYGPHGCADIPMWYAKYDKNPDNSGIMAIGGAKDRECWNKDNVSIKQYTGNHLLYYKYRNDKKMLVSGRIGVDQNIVLTRLTWGAPKEGNTWVNQVPQK